MERRSMRVVRHEPLATSEPSFGLGLVAVLLAATLVLVLSSPAPSVAAVGLGVIGLQLIRRKETLRHVNQVIGVPLLIGLFGVAVALGTVGRLWSGPSAMLSHLDTWATAGVAAILSVLVNNLPAASLLAARAPAHPFALLIGLNVGPNLFVTGSLAWLLWLRAARLAGARPSLARATRIGIVAVPLSMVAALAVLAARGLA
jgi:arsenical pump membrane protein